LPGIIWFTLNGKYNKLKQVKSFRRLIGQFSWKNWWKWGFATLRLVWKSYRSMYVCLSLLRWKRCLWMLLVWRSHRRRLTHF